MEVGKPPKTKNRGRAGVKDLTLPLPQLDGKDDDQGKIKDNDKKKEVLRKDVIRSWLKATQHPGSRRAGPAAKPLCSDVMIMTECRRALQTSSARLGAKDNFCGARSKRSFNRQGFCN